MSESSFDRVNNSIKYYEEVTVALYSNEEKARPVFDRGGLYNDSFKVMSDFDYLKNEFPNDYKKYYNEFTKRLDKSTRLLNFWLNQKILLDYHING